METYAALKQAAGHYAGERGFCSVVAIATAAGCKFGKARAAMARAGRKTGRGATVAEINTAAAEFGLNVTYNPALTATLTTLTTATRKLPRRGIFFVYTSGHISCVRDGLLNDWAAEKNSRKRVTAVAEVTQE
jgi:hypothetical protein